jgi:hypothetical protein
MSKNMYVVYLKYAALVFCIYSGSAGTANSAIVDYIIDPLTINDDSIVTTNSAGLSITATAYHVEITPTSSLIYGPFPTGQYFKYDKNNGDRTALGLNAEPVGAITPTEDDSGTALTQPGFDNKTRSGDYPTMQFALFEFSQSVDVSQIVLDNVSNFNHPIFVAAGSAAPDLDADLENAFTGFTILSNPLSTLNKPGFGLIYNFNALDNVSYLAIGTSPRDTDLGSFLAGGASQFLIHQIEYSVVPIPAAVWLFGSGLIGLVGVARRKKS